MTKHGSRFAALKSVSMALPVLVATAASEAGENDTGRSVRGTKTQVGKSDGRIGQHLTVDSPLRDLLAHPAFAGFAPLLLPWDNRTYDPNMPLHDLGSLLPYHSHVDPATSVKALNRMVDDIGQGKVVFYDFYSEAQKREQPARRYTGLFFLRGKPGASFAVIAPGGGFSYVGSVHEGFPYAEEISKTGYNAFALRYRVRDGGTVATEDLAAAIAWILRDADELGVSTKNYSLWGSSAGARMAAAGTMSCAMVAAIPISRLTTSSELSWPVRLHRSSRSASSALFTRISRRRSWRSPSGSRNRMPSA